MWFSSRCWCASFHAEIGILLLPLVVGVYFLRKKYTQAIVIFFLPLILYIVWYIRNDVYYLGLEGPTMRNSTLFFSNVLTSMDASFLEELSFAH